jgi:hypothetical protein
MSNTLIIILIIFYVVILAVSLWEHNYWRALYWLSAIGIVVATMRVR